MPSKTLVSTNLHPWREKFSVPPNMTVFPDGCSGRRSLQHFCLLQSSLLWVLFKALFCVFSAKKPSGRACNNQITGADMDTYTQGYRLQGKGACSTFFSLKEYPFFFPLRKKEKCCSLFGSLKNCCSHHHFGFHSYVFHPVCRVFWSLVSSVTAFHPLFKLEPENNRLS